MTPTAVPDEGLRLARILPVAMAALVLIVAVLTVTPWPVGAFQDDAIYTVLAKALATGEGYRMINLPGSPHATHYPPAYPFFLSLLWRLAPSFPANIVVFKFANAAWLALAASGSYLFARTRLGWGVGRASAAAVAGTLAIVVLLVTGVVLSEPMFMALLFPALLLAERASDTGSLRMAVIAGLACGLLALVRTLGAVIVPAACLVLLARRRVAAAGALAASAAVCVVPWQLWLNAWQHEVPSVLMGKYGAYGPWVADGFREGGFAFAWEVAVANAGAIVRFVGYALMPVASLPPRILVIAGACVVSGLGVVVLVRRAPVTAVFLAAYAAVVVAWPFDPDRFVLAVWPLLTLCWLAGLESVVRWRPAGPLRVGARVAVLAVCVATVAGFGTYNWRGYRHQWWASVQRDAGSRAKPIAEWVAASTTASDVLMTDDDLIVYLYTGRRAMPTSTFVPSERVRPPTDQETEAAARTMLDLYRPRYYITTSAPGQRAAERLTMGDAPLLRRHQLIPNAFIYERIAP